MNKTERYFDKIIGETGLTIKELMEMVEEKKGELKGLISEEGTLFIISRELGVDIKEEVIDADELFQIEDLHAANIKNITMKGRITSCYNIREFTKKDGTEGYVLNFRIKDKTGGIKVVAWDELAQEIFNNENYDDNVIVKIEKGYTKWSDYSSAYELVLPKWGKITFNPGESVNEESFPKKIEKDWGDF